MGFTRQALVFVFRSAIRIYFRRIEVIGEVPDPGHAREDFFCGNHVNGLVDPTLVLTTAPCAISPVGKSTLWKIPGLSWLLDAVDAVPIVRRRDDPTKSAAANDEVFDRVALHLVKGGNILIFPEGTSHNEPHLLGLRSGAGRMLARAKRDAAGLTFQAVALEFDARAIFRSRALLVYGPVREVDAIGEVGDELARAITEQTSKDLSELLVEGTTWDEHRLIVRVAEMFANDGEVEPSTMASRNDIGRRVEEARRALARASTGDAGRVYETVRTEVNEISTPLSAPGSPTIRSRAALP